MDKGRDPSLFVNDGSFMEKFKQLQQQNQEKAAVQDRAKSSALKIDGVVSKRPFENKVNDGRRPILSSSGGKLAFSLKQKSKLAAPPVKLGADEDEEEAEMVGKGSSDGGASKRQKSSQSDASEQGSSRGDGNYWLLTFYYFQKISNTCIRSFNMAGKCFKQEVDMLRSLSHSNKCLGQELYTARVIGLGLNNLFAPKSLSRIIVAVEYINIYHGCRASATFSFFLS